MQGLPFSGSRNLDAGGHRKANFFPTKLAVKAYVAVKDDVN